MILQHCKTGSSWHENADIYCYFRSQQPDIS